MLLLAIVFEVLVGCYLLPFTLTIEIIICSQQTMALHIDFSFFESPDNAYGH